MTLAVFQLLQPTLRKRFGELIGMNKEEGGA